MHILFIIKSLFIIFNIFNDFNRIIINESKRWTENDYCSLSNSILEFFNLWNEKINAKWARKVWIRGKIKYIDIVKKFFTWKSKF